MIVSIPADENASKQMRVRDEGFAQSEAIHFSHILSGLIVESRYKQTYKGIQPLYSGFRNSCPYNMQHRRQMERTQSRRGDVIRGESR